MSTLLFLILCIYVIPTILCYFLGIFACKLDASIDKPKIPYISIYPLVNWLLLFFLLFTFASTLFRKLNKVFYGEE